MNHSKQLKKLNEQLRVLQAKVDKLTGKLKNAVLVKPRRKSKSKHSN